jgi:hypothetical protein
VDERDAHAAPVEPVYDTWGLARYAGSWSIIPARADAPGNVWVEDALAATLEAFDELARPWAAGIAPVPDADAAPVSLAWRPDESQEAYREAVRAVVHDYPAPIHSLELQLDVNAHARTPESPHTPVRAWLRLPTEIELRGPVAGGAPYASLAVEHTLFRPESADGIDNRELYELNAPSLEAALRSWERRLGPITEVDGLTGIFRYGFQPEADE